MIRRLAGAGFLAASIGALVWSVREWRALREVVEAPGRSW